MKLAAWATLMLLFVPFIYAFAPVIQNGIPDMANSGDGALLEIHTRNVFSRGILLWPYSRFGFSHPGPLYFQLRYPVYELMSERNSSLFLATLLIQIACLCLSFVIVSKTAGHLRSILFSASAALFLLSADKTVWLSEWNPYIVILPFMLYTMAMAAAAVGKLRYLPVAAAAGSLAGQTHISLIPSMAAVLICSAVVFIYPGLISRENSRPFRWKHLLVSLGLLLLLWAAPLYQQLFPGEGRGNITEIVKFFEHSSPEISGQRALAVWSTMMTPGAFQGFRLSGVLIILRLVLLVMTLLLFRKRQGGSFPAFTALLCLVLHGVSLFSVNQIRGELQDYLIEWIRIVPLLSVFTLLAGALELVREEWRRYAVMVPALFVLYASVAVTAGAAGYFRPELHPSWENEIAVQELSLQLQENLDWSGEEFYAMNLVTSRSWPVMAGIINLMDKRGYPVGLESDRLYLPFPPGGIPVRVLLIGVLTDGAAIPEEPAAQWRGTVLILQ